MAIPLVLVVLPLGLLFLLSGLIVNAVQSVLFLSIRPLSKSLYRRINRFLAELLWLQLIWLVDWWAGVKVQLHADQETYQLMGKEHALIISNHRRDINWLIGWILAQRSGCLGSTLAIMKKSSKFLPVIGWSMWFAEYLFLERSWAKDENTLKGFVSAVSIMRDFVPAIYDTTVVHVRIKRHAMSDMPKSDEDVSKWCKDIFVAKDALLDKHIATGTFDEEIRPIGRPIKSLLVVLSWSCLLLYGAYRFLQWTQLLSTWKGIILFVAGLGLVTGIMHVFIMFSQSERSSSARAARNRVKKG